MTESETIKENVRERYAEIAKRAQASTTASCCAPGAASCCGPTSTADYAQKIGYALDELSDLPDAAQEGEVVLDLGSGGGIDVFIAAKKVGPTGKAIGVDMTQEMLDLATKNAEELGFENVEFRKGDIEALPVEDGTVDVIISNCVINLAPDKDKVFREAYRALKPGGRITVSDIVTDGDLPEEIKNNPDQWAACVSGALDEKLYLEKIRNAGFERVKVLEKRGFNIVKSAEVEAFKPL